MKTVLKKKIDQNLLKKIEDYMFYDKITMEKFTDEWKERIKPTNCLLFNIFNDSRCSYYKFYDIPCWYCSCQNRSSANSHSVFECIRYHRDIDILSNKLKKK